ncbi:MAG: FAD-dependent oxidoreductase [Trueperaceae bacterium]
MNAKYLVVGGGLAADAAVKALRKADPQGRTLLVSEESVAPYKRPPLSKGLWTSSDSAVPDLGTANAGAELLLGRRAVALDVAASTVTLDDSTVVNYQRLLLATGARARSLPALEGAPNVVSYRTFEDYLAVRQRVGPGAQVTVVGGGFIGAEMAAALTGQGASVTMVFPEPHVGGGRFPSSVAEIVDQDFRSRGVQLLPGRTVVAASEGGSGPVLKLSDDSEVRADLVVVGVGAVANDELAAAAGLLTAGGVLVDASLRAATAAGTTAGVFAAGDVAVFDWPQLGRRMRIEHEDNAYSMGSAAARFMVASLAEATSGESAAAAYSHLPFFYSDLFDNGYEAVGLMDPRLQQVEDWRVPGKEGVVYFLEDGLVRGVLLWNTWGQVDAARDLIDGATPYTAEELIGRLPTDD